jgi:hypothetical protein
MRNPSPILDDEQGAKGKTSTYEEESDRSLEKSTYYGVSYLFNSVNIIDRLCDLVVRVPGFRSLGPGLIPGTTTFSEK